MCVWVLAQIAYTNERLYRLVQSFITHFNLILRKQMLLGHTHNHLSQLVIFFSPFPLFCGFFLPLPVKVHACVLACNEPKKVKVKNK